MTGNLVLTVRITFECPEAELPNKTIWHSGGWLPGNQCPRRPKCSMTLNINTVGTVYLVPIQTRLNEPKPKRLLTGPRSVLGQQISPESLYPALHRKLSAIHPKQNSRHPNSSKPPDSSNDKAQFVRQRHISHAPRHTISTRFCRHSFRCPVIHHGCGQAHSKICNGR